MRTTFSRLSIIFISLIGAVSNDAGLVGAAQDAKTAPIDIAAYVPLDNGRTWTYQWTVQFEGGRTSATSRTKSFEGPEFLATGHAYRFVSDLGDYVLLSVESGKLLMHGSAEPHRNIRFMFDPPVVLYFPNMEPGRRYTITHPTEDGSSQREWTTILDGFGEVDTPMGPFRRCLKIGLEMNSAEARTKATYYYARGLGLVAYQYKAWSGKDDRPDVDIDARLKLAQLAGRSVTNSAELETMGASVTPTPRSEDPEARREFRQAYERLYLWPGSFPGFQAGFRLRRGTDGPGAAPVAQGTLTVTADLKIKVSGVDNRTMQQVETELSQFVTHLKSRPFEDQYRGAVISFGDQDAETGIEIQVAAGTSMGTSYRIKNGQIHQIGHSYGRVRFLVNHTTFSKTADGRLIPASYRIKYYSNETDQLIDQVDFQDEYINVGTLWLPSRRAKVETVNDQISTLEIELTSHRLLN